MIDVKTIIETAIENGATIEKAKYGCIGYTNKNGEFTELGESSMSIDDIKSIKDFNDYVETCTDTELNNLAIECNQGLDTGMFPRNGKVHKIMDQIGYIPLTSLDICHTVALEFMHRNVLPF